MKRILYTLILSGAAGFASPGKEQMDLQAQINRQIDEGKHTVTVLPGRYYVKPAKRAHLTLSGLSGITIIADGVEMICTENTRAVTIENCTNLTVCGLTVDYDPLPFTQGRLIEVSADAMVHEIELFDGYPRAGTVENSKYAIFDPETRRLKFGNYFNFQTEVLAPHRIRLTKGAAEKNKQGGEKAGDLVVLSAKYAPGGYEPHAVLLSDSGNVVLERITLYSSPVFGFFETHCKGSVYRDCVIDRRPADTDPVTREPRLRSLNADAYHSKFAQKGPQIIGCSAKWQGDDCVNICGSYHLVTEANGDTLRVLAKTSMDIGIGDPVELITVDGRRIPDAVVVSVRPAGKASAAETERLRTLKLLERIRGFLTNAYEVKLDCPAELPFGSVIGSMNRMGNCFAVKDCVFGSNRSRGILVKASFGEIIGNTLIDCHMQAIKIAPEYQWLESGHSSGITISNNTIINPGTEAILIHASGSHPAHKDIEIIKNTIRSNIGPVISISGLKGGTVQNNAVERLDGSPMDSPVLLKHCENVVTGN